MNDRNRIVIVPTLIQPIGKMRLLKNSYLKGGKFYFVTVGENYVAIDTYIQPHILYPDK